MDKKQKGKYIKLALTRGIEEVVKEAQKELLNKLSDEFQPDVRMDVIFPTNLEEWINNARKSIKKQ